MKNSALKLPIELEIRDLVITNEAYIAPKPLIL